MHACAEPVCHMSSLPAQNMHGPVVITDVANNVLLLSIPNMILGRHPAEGLKTRCSNTVERSNFAMPWVVLMLHVHVHRMPQ